MLVPGVALAVPIEFVTVGNTGNVADSTNFGAVNYEYDIGKYEVTNAQYAEMLNAVAAGDLNDLWDVNMGSSSHGGITRGGTSGSYTYSLKVGFDNKPVNFVSWRDAARFTNWMHNGKTTITSSTESGAYDTSTFGGSFGNFPDQAIHDVGASHWIVTENEWYKAAYYSPALNSGSGGYYDYPTQSDVVPIAVAPTGGSNSANFGNAVGTVTDVGSYTGSASWYGTFDQGGNVWEWNEDWQTVAGPRSVRGGVFTDGIFGLESTTDLGSNPIFGTASIGFRLASTTEPVPEPATIALLGIGLAGLAGAAVRRRLKKTVNR